MNDQFATYPSLKGKSVIITGGASGIGAQIVEAFAQQGSKVGFLDLNETQSKSLKGHLGENINYEICDLKDITATQTALAKLEEKIGTPTVLVNNAAHDDRHNWQDVTPEYFDERIATNLRHHFFSIQALAPGMIKKGGGSIINVGSNSWWEAVGNLPVYATAKAAIHGLTRTMARDLGDDRIRVNCVVPGWIMTERQKELWVTPQSVEKHRARQCLPDLIDPVYVARMVVFLASDDAKMCSASNFMVDAGSI